MKFSKDFKEAEALYIQHCKLDPFPQIGSALLNSADIANYVQATGLIWPFDTSIEIDYDDAKKHNFRKDEFNDEADIVKLCCAISKLIVPDPKFPTFQGKTEGIEYLNCLLHSHDLLGELKKNTNGLRQSCRILMHKTKYDTNPNAAQLVALNRVVIEDYFDDLSPKSNRFQRLKPASYEIPFRGEVYHWNEDNCKVTTRIEKPGDKYELNKNSIAFVCLDTIFQVPEYIALRFNLRITHVHRGLLLGTGPLIDPGFAGRLLIPLHNLTNNSYVFNYEDGFIWVEFTKLNVPLAAKNYTFMAAEFPEDKKRKNASYYFEKANNGNYIDSSVANLNLKISEFEKTYNTVKIAFPIAAFAFIVGLVALIYGGYNLITSTNKLILSVQTDIARKYDDLKKENDLIRKELQVLTTKKEDKP